MYRNFDYPFKKRLTIRQGANPCSVSNFAPAVVVDLFTAINQNRSWPARGRALGLGLQIPNVS